MIVFILLSLGLMTGLMNMLMLNRNYKTVMTASVLAKNSTGDSDRKDKNDDDSPTFQWDYLDLDQGVKCGADKCLFRSSSRTDTTVRSNCNESNFRNNGENLKCADTMEYQTGYLVGKGKHDESISDGWKIAKYLTARFGIKHFFLEPPIQMELDKSRFEVLFRPKEENDEKKQEFEERLLSMDDVVTTWVQKIEIAPATSRELRRLSSDDNVVASLEALLEGFRDDRGMPKTYNSTSHQVLVAAEDCGFFQHLNSEVTRTIELLHCEPLMALDFQLILDTSGNLYHLDFDRVLTNQGALRYYNQMHFDDKVRTRLERSLQLLGVVRKWIETKQHQARYGMDQLVNTTATKVSAAIEGKTCKGDWEAEETTILASKNLPCLATERMAIARHTTTSTMAINEKVKSMKDRGTGDSRLRHPLLIALLRRVIEAGFYDNADDVSWDCNAFGDRVEI